MDTTESVEDIGVALDQAVRKFAQLLLRDDLNLSIADFVRLMQIRKEYGGTQKPVITVQWVDEWGSSLPIDQ